MHGSSVASRSRRSVPESSARSALAVRIAELDAHGEAVELRLGQREGADLLRGVLRGDDEERRGQLARLAFGGDLVLFHRLEQRRLRLGRGAVDLVGEDHLREDRPGMELEAAAFALVDRHADDVGGQHVAGELDALELQPERAREHVRERGLAHAGQVLDQQMAAREQARERQAHLCFLAEDDAAGRLDHALDRPAREIRRLKFGLQQHAAIVLDCVKIECACLPHLSPMPNA